MYTHVCLNVNVNSMYISSTLYNELIVYSNSYMYKCTCLYLQCTCTYTMSQTGQSNTYMYVHVYVHVYSTLQYILSNVHTDYMYM